MSLALGEALAGGRSRLAAAGLEQPHLEAQLLLGHAAGMDRVGLFTRGHETLAAPVQERFRILLAARARRVPLAYLTGEREFWSLRFAVDPHVLIPRPETETLVAAALDRLAPGAKLVDIGTGSGAVIIAVAREMGRGRWWATDRSPEALAVARVNAATHGLAGRITFACGDLCAPLAGEEGSFDAMVSNPPYIPSADLEGLQPEVRDHEPRLALDGGANGLDILTRLVREAPRFLKSRGWLLVEIGAGQAEDVRALAHGTGAYGALDTCRDLAGHERVIAAQRS